MTVALRHGEDLRRISRELRRMDDREILKRFRKELRAAAKPMVPAVRRSIRSIPSKRAYRADGLRGRMSRATKLEVKTSGKRAGIVLRVDGRRMGARQGALPAYMEGTKPRWRHPVWGRDVWVQQPAKPYFYRAVAVLGARSRRNVDRVVDGITRDIR